MTQEPGQEMQFFGHVEPVPDRGTHRAQRPPVPADRRRHQPRRSGRLDQARRERLVPGPHPGRRRRRGRAHQRARAGPARQSRARLHLRPLDEPGRHPLLHRDRPAGLGQSAVRGPGRTAAATPGEQMALGTLTERDLQRGRPGPGLRRVPDPAGADPRAHAHGGPLPRLAPVPGSAAPASARQPEPAVVAGTNLGPGFELEYTLRALAPGQPPGRQPVTGLPVPGAPCVLDALGRRASSRWLAGREARAPLAAQDALNRVGPKTQVRSVEFEFTGKSSLDEDQLRQKIALTGQGGMVGLRPPLRLHAVRAAGGLAPVRSDRDGARRGPAPALLPALGLSQGRRATIDARVPGEVRRRAT